MRTVYSRCLQMQYTLWVLYLVGLLALYIIGFFVETLSLRWFLVPATVGVLIASIALSFVIVVLFFVHGSSVKGDENGSRFRLLCALPSMIMVVGTVIYLLEGLVKGGG